jgi:hypothetical protein
LGLEGFQNKSGEFEGMGFRISEDLINWSDLKVAYLGGGGILYGRTADGTESNDFIDINDFYIVMSGGDMIQKIKCKNLLNVIDN